MAKHSFRLRKLVDPRLQLRLSLVLVGAVVFSLLFQFIVLASRVSTLAAELSGSDARAAERLMHVLPETLLWSLAVVLPAALVVGVLATFRIAGPLYALHEHLRALARGEATQECRLRRGDALQGLCDTLNEATRPLLRASVERRSAEKEAAGREAA